MSKLISATTTEEQEKYVEIKHVRTMQDANGNDVDVIDYVDRVPVEQAIKQAEEEKSTLEAKVAELTTEITEYEAIRDAE